MRKAATTNALAFCALMGRCFPFNLFTETSALIATIK